MKLEGGCFCGALKYQINSSPQRVTHCHCIHCRRTSGAPFLTWAAFESADFTFTAGTPARCETRAKVTRLFCPQCGTQLTYQHAEKPNIIDVTVGSLDTPGAVTPQDHIWCDRMLAWLHLDDGLPRYALEKGG